MELMTTNEVADCLNIHPTTMRRYALEGVVPSVRVGSRYRFDLDQVVKALEDRKHGTQHGKG